MEQAIKEIKKLLEEANEYAEDTYPGYEAGWYDGAASAYEIVLEIL